MASLEFSVFVDSQWELSVDELQAVSKKILDLVDSSLKNAVVGPVVVRQAKVFDGVETPAE